MPCRSDYSDNYTSISYNEYNKMKAEIDLTTRLLCSIMTLYDKEKLQKGVLPKTVNFLGLDSELRNWWNKHQEEDRKREAAEAKAKADAIEANTKKIADAVKALKKYGVTLTDVIEKK